jgi:iron complex outermembrane receptor protein
MGESNMNTRLASLTAAAATLATISAVGLLLAPAPLLAQEGSAKAIEEIVVTSRRREESLQEVPIAVTAYSGEYLAEIGAIDIVALTQSSPNTTLEVSRATNTTLTAYIRGIGQQDPVAGFEGGVGIYLDDVYLARPQATVFDIYDVERIEVLRGPQGTLYGRNTIGGAVRYVTRRLSTDPQLEVKASLGSYSQADLLLSGSMPVSDTFRIGGSAATFNRDGFGTNLFTGADNANKEILAFRGSMEWEPSDSFFLRLYGDYSIDDSNPRSGHRFLPSAVTGDPVLADVFDTNAGITTIPSSNGGITQEVTQGGAGLYAEWNLDDQWTLKSITSYREDDSDSLIDFDETEANTFDAPVNYTNDQFSQEFQANFSGDKLSGVFGLYYLDANAFDAFDVVIGGSGVTAFTLGDYNTKAWAGFADLSYDINEQFNVSIGGRYTEDERTATVTRETFLGLGSPYFGNSSAISITVPVPGFVPTFNGNRTDSKFTPRASIGWAPVDEHHLYLSYAEGFKGGGFDPRGAYQFPEVQAGFEPEEVETWEVGAKSIWGDGKLMTNIAVFTSDYTNVQVPGSIILFDANGNPNGFAGTTTNAGKASIDGFEIEALAQFTDAFSAKLALGYVDAEYTEWLIGGTDSGGNPILIDVADQRVFQNTPEWNGNLTLRYEWPLSLFGNQGGLALIGSASYKDFTYQFEIPQPLVDQPSYTLIDASLVWTADDNRYQLALYGRNLSDEEYVVANYNFATVDGSVIGFYGNPQTVTLTGTIRF